MISVVQLDFHLTWSTQAPACTRVEEKIGGPRMSGSWESVGGADGGILEGDRRLGGSTVIVDRFGPTRMEDGISQTLMAPSVPEETRRGSSECKSYNEII